MYGAVCVLISNQIASFCNNIPVCICVCVCIYLGKDIYIHTHTHVKRTFCPVLWCSLLYEFQGQTFLHQL